MAKRKQQMPLVAQRSRHQTMMKHERENERDYFNERDPRRESIVVGNNTVRVYPAIEDENAEKE